MVNFSHFCTSTGASSIDYVFQFSYIYLLQFISNEHRNNFLFLLKAEVCSVYMVLWARPSIDFAHAKSSIVSAKFVQPREDLQQKLYRRAEGRTDMPKSMRVRC